MGIWYRHILRNEASNLAFLSEVEPQLLEVLNDGLLEELIPIPIDAEVLTQGLECLLLKRLPCGVILGIPLHGVVRICIDLASNPKSIW